MTSWLFVASLAVALGPRTGAVIPASAADAVVLNDGRVALGQMLDPGPGADRVFVVRRVWARANIPDWVDRWQAAETLAIRRAMRERRLRLSAWRKERVPPVDGFDPILPWIERELIRLTEPRNWTQSPLMAVTLGRGDIRSVTYRTDEVGRFLRLGWLAGLADVETLPIDDLRATLRRRGVRLDLPDPAPIESLLPLLPETEPQWLTRRAATEIAVDPGLRLIQTGQWLTRRRAAVAASDPGPNLIDSGELLLPERSPVIPGLEVPNHFTLLDSPAAREVFASINSLPPTENSREALFRGVASRGGVGLVLTRVGFSADFSEVEALATFWVRVGPGRWVPVVTRRVEAIPATPGPDTPVTVDSSSTIQTMLAVLQMVAARASSTEENNSSLIAGAAAQRAINLAHRELDPLLARLALPVGAPAGRR